ncbi:MAG: cellobiose phosphorylase [Candidatus Omnitrophota bacterium]
MPDKLWRFTDHSGSFECKGAGSIKTLYFPLANENLMSSLSPDGHGDIKSAQNSFLLTPVSRQDLIDSRALRNFWIKTSNGSVLSLLRDGSQREPSLLVRAGLLWQEVVKENKDLKLEILSFIPSTGEPVEIMRVKVTNISRRKINFTPTAAIPIYARGASNIRDHRQVTSLLQRIYLDKFGVIVKPTLSFDESGHKPNKNNYFVLSWDEKFNPPEHIYPTQEMFCGDSGTLETPEVILKDVLPSKANIQGKEAMGALRFRNINVKPGQSRSYIIVMGISDNKANINKIISKFNILKKIDRALEKTKEFWINISQKISVSSSDKDFNNWLFWVSIQPILRKIFGCSFLPDFDYGKGGRGWRDLWQDCLGLILNDPKDVAKTLLNNFSGVRIDGSNATIIGKKPGEFIADRNDIARVWMDHGVWPLITLELYINETGDKGILFKDAPYFADKHIWRSQRIRRDGESNKVLTRSGKIYQGSVFEHLLVQNLTQFFNVGQHNHIRLEGADWNDGLDMAAENGESVAFSAMYARNLTALAQVLEESGSKEVLIAEELKILLTKFNYSDIKKKRAILENYFKSVELSVSGKKIKISTRELCANLKEKSNRMAEYIRKREWLKEGFFNGYYNNVKKRVEGKQGSVMRMMFQSQVFPIMSGVASDAQVQSIIKSAEKHLFDKKIGGYRLNTDFGQEEHNFGRAFSFVYGDKENGAVFSHMVVMYAYALYKRGFVKEGWRALSSLYKLALNTSVSKIYPCLPEYFNLEGRGMYSYLTGSASWFMLTLLTESFGVKSKNGDLVIEPKLTLEQFKNSPVMTISRTFAGRRLQISFSNPKKLEYGKYRIKGAKLNSFNFAPQDSCSIILSRKIISRLSAGKIHKISISLA